MRSAIKALFELTGGYELADAVIERVQCYAARAVAWSVEQDVSRTDANHVNALKEVICYELTGYLSHLITDTHQEFIVRVHARGLSTPARDFLLHVIFHKLPFNPAYSTVWNFFKEHHQSMFQEIQNSGIVESKN